MASFLCPPSRHALGKKKSHCPGTHVANGDVLHKTASTCITVQRIFTVTKKKNSSIGVSQ